VEGGPPKWSGNKKTRSFCPGQKNRPAGQTYMLLIQGERALHGADKELGVVLNDERVDPFVFLLTRVHVLLLEREHKETGELLQR